MDLQPVVIRVASVVLMYPWILSNLFLIYSYTHTHTHTHTHALSRSIRTCLPDDRLSNHCKLLNGGRRSFVHFLSVEFLHANYRCSTGSPKTYLQVTAWPSNRVCRVEGVSCVREDGTTFALMSSSWPPRPTVGPWPGFTCTPPTSATSTSSLLLLIASILRSRADSLRSCLT